MSSWEEQRSGQRGYVYAPDVRELCYPSDRSSYEKPKLRKCPQCGTEFFERIPDECCPKCGSFLAENQRPAQTFLALVGIATESSKASEDDVLAQLRKMKSVREAHAIFPLVLACEGALANIAAIVETETWDELKMVLSDLRQVQEVRSMLMKLASSKSEAARMLEAARFPKKSGKPVFRESLGCC